MATVKQTKPSDIDLSDAPAKECDIFLVDGNGLAYRAFFALPEELQTAEGQPDQRAAGHRQHDDAAAHGLPAADGARGLGREARAAARARPRVQGRPPADAATLLREQQPFFEPIVNAFGYRNVRVAGQGGRRCDRHAATRGERGRPPGVRGVHRPRRVPAGLRQRLHHDDAARRGRRGRLHARPDPPALRHRPRADPRLHRPQGRHVGQHQGRARASARRPPPTCSSSSAAWRASTSIWTRCPARSAASRCARPPRTPRSPRCWPPSTAASPVDVDLTSLVVEPPDRSTMKELFRKLEFRALLKRVDELEEAVPGARAGVPAERAEVPWREGTLADLGQLPHEVVAGGRGDGRAALAAAGATCWWSTPPTGRRSVRGAGLPARADARAAPGGPAAGRRHRDRGLPDRSRPRGLRGRRPGRGAGGRADGAGRRGDGGAGAAAAATALRITPGWPTLEQRRADAALPATSSCRWCRCWRRWRRPASSGHLPAGRDRRQAARPGRRARGAGLRAGRRPVHARLAQAARRGAVRAAGAARRPQGQDRVLHRRPGAGQAPRPAPDHRGGRGLARAVEAAEHLPASRCPALVDPATGRLHTTFSQTTAATGRLSSIRPNLQNIPIRTPLGREIRGAFVAEPGCATAVGRLLPGGAADPRPPVRRAGAEGRVRPRRGHPPRHRRRGAGQAGRGADVEERTAPRRSTSGSSTGSARSACPSS